MSHLPERYSFADFRKALRKSVNGFALLLGDFARFIDGLTNDFVLTRTTRFSWAQARLARALDFNLTIGGTAGEIRKGLLLRLNGRPAGEAWELARAIDELFPEQNGSA